MILTLSAVAAVVSGTVKATAGLCGLVVTLSLDAAFFGFEGGVELPVCQRAADEEEEEVGSLLVPVCHLAVEDVDVSCCAPFLAARKY